MQTMNYARQIDRPTETFFRTRLIKGGPWVPASIYRPEAVEIEETLTEKIVHVLDRWPALEAEINGKQVKVMDLWQSSAVEITKQDYDFLVGWREWARVHSPEDPVLRPEAPIDLNKMKPIF
jgi:hypothetical protein